jgi:mRNA interferase RelE/StbE
MAGGGSDYQVVFARSASKELQRLPERLALRILKRIAGLQSVPRPRGSRKLAGSANLWRIRIGHYRVIYSIDDERRVVDVSVVRHRRDAYQ